MQFDVLVNAGAGSVNADERSGEIDAIRDAFAAAGATAEVRMVEPADMHDAAETCWAANPRPRAVVVAGGDGTVSCLAGAAAGTDMVLGVLPLGTFNHFAKDLGVPTDLTDAALALTAATARQVDVAEVNGRVFVNNSVLGLYPDLVSVREQLQEHRGWGKVRAVPVAAVRVLRRFPLHRLDLTGPGFSRRRVRTPLVFIGNGVFTNERRGAPTREELADGALGVAIAHVVSRWKLISTVVRALVRGVDAVDDLDTIALTELTIAARARRIRVAVDGEVCWMALPLRYRIRPGALNVLGPPE